jgi:hypothetical protein
MSSVAPATVLDRLAALRTELVEQAYLLERQGRLDAADVAVATSLRIGEVCDELAGERTE